MKVYVVVDIGCIECGEPSELIGIYTDKFHAEDARLQAEEEQQKNWSGQHSFEIFESELPNTEGEVTK